MKKFKTFLFCVACMIATDSAKAQFQSIQWSNSLEYIKFSGPANPESVNNGTLKNPPSYRFGLDAQWRLTSNISLRTGFRYSNIIQYRKDVYVCAADGSYYIDLFKPYLVKAINLEAPIGIRYSFNTKKRFQSYVEPFGSAVFDLNGNIFPEIGFAYGIEYTLNKRFGIFAQPTYRHTFNDKSTWDLTQVRNNYSLEFGVRLKKKNR